MLYIVQLVGTGRDDDPYRVPTEEPGQGWIDLRADCTKPGHGLLYLPTADPSPRLQKIADDVRELPAQAAKVAIFNRFGVTPLATRLDNLIAELLLEHGRHDGTRWKPLRPSKLRQRFEIFLGGLGLIWQRPQFVPPSTTSFTETWPTNGDTISSGQDQPWTETQGDIDVSAGKAIPGTTAGGTNRARCDTPLDTDNHEHFATFTANRDANTRSAALHVRESTADQTYYNSFVRRNSGGTGDLRALRKSVAGTSTILASDTTDPGTGVEIRTVADGSTITMKLGGAQIHQVTDTDITGHVRVGLTLLSASATGVPTWDGHTARDLAISAIIGQVSETDLAQAFGRLKTRLAGQVSETDLAQAFAAVKARAIGQVSELDTAGAFVALKALALAQASELDVAQALTALKLLAIGQATEADIAQAMTPLKARSLGQATETDEAQALTSHKTRLLGQVTEVDEAMPMTRAGDAIGQASETDTAGILTPLKTRELAAVSETDAAQAMTAAKSQTAGQAAEADLAQPLAHLKQKALAQAAELDEARALTPSHAQTIGQPSETDLAQAFAVEKRRVLGTVFEEDEAMPFTPIGGAQAVIPVVTLALPLHGAVTLAATIHPPALTFSLPLHPET